MTVFKNIALEADGASKLAIALIKGGDVASIASSTVDDTVTKKKVAFVAETPTAVSDATGVKAVIATGYTTAANVCKIAGQSVCDKAGIK